MSSIIEFKNAKFSWYENKNIINIENLEIKKSEHILIHGKSGGGKTTLLSLLAGINTLNKGSLKILNQELSSLSNTKRDTFRADYMGVIFQQFNLLSYLSIIENVEISCMFSKKRKQKAKSKNASTILSTLGIPKNLHSQNISKLSIGQQQRVAVARAIIGSPDIIIADEPTSALDEENRDIFLDFLFEQASSSTIIYVSHDLSIAHRFKQVYKLESFNKGDN